MVHETPLMVALMAIYGDKKLSARKPLKNSEKCVLGCINHFFKQQNVNHFGLDQI